MKSQVDIKYLYRLVHRQNLKIYIFFKNSRYVLVINRYIHAEDKNENYVEWSRAFGSSSPSNIITNFPIEKIKLKLKDRIIYFSSIRDLIKNMQF
jgi:hypothetical protein